MLGMPRSAHDPRLPFLRKRIQYGNHMSGDIQNSLPEVRPGKVRQVRGSGRRTSASVWLWSAVIVYLILSAILFVFWVNPSLSGETTQHISADSYTYAYFAETLLEGRYDPWVLNSLSTFPNTLWGPVLLGLLFQNTVAIALADYAILCIAVWLFYRAFDIDVGLFLVLLAANVTTFISLLSLNKEIFDLLVVALFAYYLGSRETLAKRRTALAIGLIIAIICRFETALCILAFLGMRSRLNPLRRWRKTSLVALVMILTFALPTLYASSAMSSRVDEAEASATAGGLLLLFDELQKRYLFFLIVIPKALDNLFAQLISFGSWPSYSLDDAANTIFLFGNNLANLVIMAVLFARKRFALQNDLVYFAILTAILISAGTIIQPRYFYGAYTLLCVEAARRWNPTPIRQTAARKRRFTFALQKRIEQSA